MHGCDEDEVNPASRPSRPEPADDITASVMLKLGDGHISMNYSGPSDGFREFLDLATKAHAAYVARKETR